MSYAEKFNLDNSPEIVQLKIEVEDIRRLLCPDHVNSWGELLNILSESLERAKRNYEIFGKPR